ncbi:sigma-54-dependent Fis family transcriptional regulator [Candidatus Poribacteria bacterium]|nr:sigma-54-dependent Fis family transcriptional regulator [Candidatus Poribacteria bacterium]
MNAKILIVDDIPANLNLLRQNLESSGYKVVAVPSGTRALQVVERTEPDVILLDILMPEMDGFETCRRLKANPTTADIPVIFITAKDETESVVEGFRLGGVDYITKPFKEEEVLVRVQTHLKIHRLTQELIQKNRELQAEIARREQAEAEREKAEDALIKADEELSMLSQREVEHWGIDGFIGKSHTINKILNEVRQLQEVGTTSVLITGESGTGKELIARALHYGSARARGRFIPVNCSAIPSELVESTLFGHLKGAFTGASEPKRGYFELADGGTLFLDEIGEMPFDLQAKLLRVLEDGTFTPVGGTVQKRATVRVLAATNADIQKKIAGGTFRSDLYFRLARFIVEVPPLRERREDIPLLAEHFLKMFAAEMSIAQRVEGGKDGRMKGRQSIAQPSNLPAFQPPRLSSEALEALMRYDFPGNVRELKNIIEGALILSRGGIIQPEHLRFVQLPSAAVEDAPASPPPPQSPLYPPFSKGGRGDFGGGVGVGAEAGDSTSTSADPGGIQGFLEACCEFHPDAEVHKPELLQRYHQFCRIQGHDPIPRNKFYQHLTQLYPQVESTLIGEKRLAGFKGLMLTPLS